MYHIKTPARLSRSARLLAILAIMLTAGVALTGCGTTFDRPFVFETSAVRPTAVDVVNNKGGVEIRIDPKLETVRVEASVHVGDDVNEELRQAVSDEIEIYAALEETEGGRAVLRVRAESPRPYDRDHRVAVLITMPRCDGALVRNRGGDAILVNVAGALQVETSGGAIEVRTEAVIDAPIALIADTGNVYFQAPPGSRGLFELTSGEGVVSLASVDRPENVYARGDMYRARLNDGVNPVRAHSDDGNVRVWIRENPTAMVRIFR